MKFLHLIFFFLIFLTSCTRFPPHEKAGYICINKHIKTMLNSEEWVPEAIGGSFYDDDIKVLTVRFIASAEEFDVDYLRSLMVKGVETFLNSINSNEELIPHLNHFPFTCNDLNYGISLYTTEGKWLGHSFLLKGNLCFFKTNEFKHTEQVHEEPYTEALQLIKAGLAIPAQQIAESPL